MALTPRKKKGLGFFITGVVFFLAGGMTLAFTEDPNWWGAIMMLIGFIADYFGFKIVEPDTD